MNELMKYFNDINAQFNINDHEWEEEKEIPKVMHDFYKTFNSVDLPYGRIYGLELALKNSKKTPFFPDWFVFGQDNYSCFWLCFKGKDNNDLYFTYWDHESGLDIEEPVWGDLLTFLKEVEEDSNDEW